MSAQRSNPCQVRRNPSVPTSKCTGVKARMGAKIHLRCKLSQVLLMYSLLASAAAASLDDKIRAGETHIQLQPGTHAFSGVNVSGSLTIVGASAGDTTVECSGAFAVMGALALHNLSITGCMNCQLDATIRASSGHVSLENVYLTSASRLLLWSRDHFYFERGYD